ncbi:MAG: hypothetical protein K2N05_00655 [Muribaculaceae bacterium]|nr:hypothetical protein [Muribaculaceae bacterium]
MKKRNIRKYHALVGMCVLLMALKMLVGCTTEECYDNRNALPYAGFYGVKDGKMAEVSIDSVAVYGIGAPGDSLLHDGYAAISDLYIPFRIDSDTTSYVFRLINKSLGNLVVADTVDFIYTRDMRFVSSACGASYIFNIEKIRNRGVLIDSVVCPEGKITNANIQNLKIYFNTGEELNEE